MVIKDFFIEYLESNVGSRYVSGGSQLQLDECPFCGHTGHDSRIYVGVTTGLGFCHHCETGFSGVKYVMEKDGVKYREAIKILTGEDGRFLKLENGQEDEDKLKEIPLPEVLPINVCDDAQDYLQSRNITDEMIEHFQLQYIIKNMNVVFPNKEEKQYKTKYRIFIPIFDINGAIVSWQARDTTGRAKNKYLFPPEFKSAEYLYNVNAIQQNPKYLILSEGVFDVFGWWRCGFKNCVATFGKKISDRQVEIIRAINPGCVFMAWDADALKAKYRFCEDYGYLFNIKLIDLPNSKDADECCIEELIDAVDGSYKYDWSKKILRLL